MSFLDDILKRAVNKKEVKLDEIILELNRISSSNSSDYTEGVADSNTRVAIAKTIDLISDMAKSELSLIFWVRAKIEPLKKFSSFLKL